MSNVDKQYFTGFGGLFEPVKNTRDRRGRNFEIIHARVMDIILDRGHPKYVDDANIGMISYRDVLTTDDTTYSDRVNDRWALPSNKLVKTYPLIGESVMIVKSLSPYSYVYPNIRFDYYFAPLPLYGELNYNPLPFIKKGAKTEDDEVISLPPGKYFSRKKHHGLLPLEGDVIIEGRFGGSIRFSNSASTPLSNWSDNGIPADPIVILSAHKFDSASLRTENVNVDNSSIWVSSNQRIPIRVAIIDNNQLLLRSWDTDLAVTNTSINQNVNSQTVAQKIIDSGEDSSV